MAGGGFLALLLLVRACNCHSLSETVPDAVSLMQRSAAEVPSMIVSETETLGLMKLTAAGPIAFTELGEVLGQAEDDHFVFKGIPYAEAPRRFQKAVPKEPWSPKRLVAKQYKKTCVGSGTSQEEGEDCLHLNIWLPKSGQRDLPVVVYFHGGLNMHGSGSEALRQGDGIVQSAKYPAIFINFDFRLGIFGWIQSTDETVVSNNLGFFDQQEALRWIHRNVAAFGGDPSRVALMGQSEGGSNIMNHLAAPGSAGLFHRAIFHSPPAEIWSSNANAARTDAMLKIMGCNYPDMATKVECLRRIPAQKLWTGDWTPEDLSRNMFSPRWFKTVLALLKFSLGKQLNELPQALGWHLSPTGDTVPGNVHDLIAQGKWNKVPILITISKNESFGLVPNSEGAAGGHIRSLLGLFVGQDDVNETISSYEKSLLESGITSSEGSLMHQMVTDKLFTCEAWALAKEITQGGGSVQLGMFWHSPRWDPVGRQTNGICDAGATCHAAEMLYSLPQGHGRGIPSVPSMKEEVAFAQRYRDEVLAFASGHQGPWEPYSADHQVITFYDRHGPRVEEGYRKKQCEVLDRHMADWLPEPMRRRAQR